VSGCLSAADDEVQHEPQKRCEKGDDRPQKCGLVAPLLGVGVDPDDDGELHEQCEEAEQEDERAALLVVSGTSSPTTRRKNRCLWLRRIKEKASRFSAG